MLLVAYEMGGEQIYRGHKGRVQRLTFSPDGNFLASGSYDETARIWDLSTGKEATRPLRYQDAKYEYDKVYHVAYSADGKWLATSGANHNAVVWNAATGSPVFARQHEGQVFAVAFSGKQLASVSEDGVLKIWEIPSGNLIVSIVSPAENNDSPKKLPLLDVNFSSDGERLVMATGTPTVLLMDAATRQMTALPSSEVRPIIMTAQFTPDGKQIITTGRDSVVKFWDATTGQEVKSLTVHNKKVNDVTISNDGKWIATASLDGTFHVSPLNTNDLLAIGCSQVNGRRLTDGECKKFLGTDKCPPPPCN